MFEGSDLEHEYFLLSAGIPSKDLIQNARKGILPFHHQYIQTRIEIDQQEKSLRERSKLVSGTIQYPNSRDVLIGRGAPYNNFTGNIRWEHLIGANVGRYMKGNSFEKTCLSMEMVKTIQEMGGCFVQRETNVGWKMLDDVSAREKASRAFRNLIAKSS